MTTWRGLLNKFVEALEDEPKELNMVTWRKLLEFTKLLDETDLKKEILISNPSRKLHFVSFVCSTKTDKGAFPEGTKYMRAGAKPADRTSQLYTKWSELVKFIEEIKQEELDQEALICSPKSELHAIPFCKQVISDDGWFARGTIYLQTGKKKFKYWVSHFEKKKICLCRGVKDVDEYKFLELKSNVKNQFAPSGELMGKNSDVWVLDKHWHSWTPVKVAGAYTIHQKRLIEFHIRQVTEDAIQKIMSVDGTSKSFKFKKKEEPKEKEEQKDYKYWYEHIGNRFGGKIYLYRGVNGIEENCLLDMTSGIWLLEKKWTATSRGFPLPVTVIKIPFTEVDKFLSLVGTTDLFDWQVNSKIYKYWYLHIVHPEKCEEMYLCRGEKEVEEFMVMKKWLVKSGLWTRLKDEWSKWSMALPFAKKDFWVKKNLTEVTDYFADKILSCDGKSEMVSTSKRMLPTTEHKYWYIHMENKWGDSIYVYRGISIEDIKSYKQIIGPNGRPGNWELYSFDWDDVVYSVGSEYNATMPMPIKLLKENLIGISKTEVDRLLSINGKPDTFDCKTHVTSYSHSPAKRKAPAKIKTLPRIKYNYWYWVTQKNDEKGRIEQRLIYLCRGLCREDKKPEEYCLLQIFHRNPFSLGVDPEWSFKEKPWVPWVGMSSLLKAHGAVKGVGPGFRISDKKWKIVTQKLKQICKNDADKILALEGAVKTFICKNIIDWPGADGPGCAFGNTERLKAERAPKDSEYKYSYWAEQAGSKSSLTHRRICLLRSLDGRYNANTAYKMIYIHHRGVLSKWKTEANRWKDCGRLTLGQIVGVGRKKIKPNPITYHQARLIQKLVGKTKEFCCKEIINWEKGESRNHPTMTRSLHRKRAHSYRHVSGQKK